MSRLKDWKIKYSKIIKRENQGCRDLVRVAFGNNGRVS
jgi:hypothetical protein